ncbi:MAG: hypothetical protein JSU95_03595, partial [Betaproteobacteria bacterium]
ALNMSKLTRAQSGAMISKLTDGKALPDDLLEQILARTDGVPLFVEELTKAILESGELTEAGDRYEYAGGTHSVTIPATLRDSLMARLDRYAPVKEIAQIGAAIGREFSYELIASVAPLPKEQLDHVLNQLTDSGLAFRRGTPPDAIYTFKHALVQDAAYDSLLKSKRQELHGKIAKVLGERFFDTSDTEPEVLAHHLTMGGRTEDAIPLWQKAGELALKRMALAEAIAHLNRGLELVATLRHSRGRDASELALRTSLGIALQTFKGWASPEMWDCFNLALALAKSLKQSDALLPVLDALAFYVLARGRPADGLVWAQETLDLAESTGDSDLLVAGHAQANAMYGNLARFAESLEHFNQVMAIYDDEKHYHLADIINPDPKTAAGQTGAMITWCLGYFDRAMRISDEIIEHSRRRAHPFDLGGALVFRADLFDLRREPEDARKCAEECERLGRENSIPALHSIFAPIRSGIASVRKGDHAEGIIPLKAGLDLWNSAGGKFGSPYFNSVLAEGMALNGDVDNALRLIDEQIEWVEDPGRSDRWYYAEMLRLKGWMFLVKASLDSAEKCYVKSLEVAREQKAKSWELRTSTSLARLWQDQGKRKEAHDLLEPVYSWFTEGFDTKDLKEAKALLEELEVTV